MSSLPKTRLGGETRNMRDSREILILEALESARVGSVHCTNHYQNPTEFELRQSLYKHQWLSSWTGGLESVLTKVVFLVPEAPTPDPRGRGEEGKGVPPSEVLSVGVCADLSRGSALPRLEHPCLSRGERDQHRPARILEFACWTVFLTGQNAVRTGRGRRANARVAR